jgi:hypothetical protein
MREFQLLKNTGIFFLCTTLFLFISLSCSDTEPEILTTDVSVIFDFADDRTEPVLRFSVFVEPYKELQRARYIKVTCPEDGYEWFVETPVLISSAKGQWAGSSCLYPRQGEDIMRGTYTVAYVDRADHEADGTFSVSYPEKLVHAKAGDVASILGEMKTESVALYAENSKLLYYGNRKKNWVTDADIWKEYPEAVRMRICLSVLKNSVICLMPPVLKGPLIKS